VKTYLLALLAFFLGVIAVLGYQYLRTRQISTPAISIPSKISPTPQPTFALTPPSEAVSGTLTVLQGHAEKFSRNDTEYKEASTGAQILIGESIATKENSIATASVSGIVSLQMGPDSELVFANLFPSDFVIQQKSGKIDYLVVKPISIRALHSLVTIDSGDVIINIINTDMSITVKTGSLKFALVDSNNDTHVWTLKAGQRANIDDAYRQVFLQP